MKKFNKNAKKTRFLETFPANSIHSSDIETRFKFNFSYFDDSQDHCTSFADLAPGELALIVNKIKDFTRQDLIYWRNRRCGGGGLKILADYGSFPINSNFKHPKYVPHDVNWCRFRLDNMARLIGFTIPGKVPDKEGIGATAYDRNTFYLVFIDLNHNFYITEER
ncbi:hypothetical protein [Pseudomonas putida]|uniref:hypothetical protein n=1 Tax=Pseudomonas putida TaxID=303 RepID=UPI00226468F6|nr:hypothetical protein [Pseudomonas putida]